MTYIIIENDGIMNGEMYDHEGVVNASVYADPGAVILSFDLAEAIRDGAASIRVVTEDIVRDAHAAGLYDDPEFDRRHLAGEFIDFPQSRDEHEADRADTAWSERGAA